MDDRLSIRLEQSLDFCIKCNICTTACPVAAVTDLFPGPKYVGPQAARFRHDQAEHSPDHSVDYCSGCRVCNEVCPTGVPIAELNARARAQMVREKGLPLRNRMLGRSELLGMLGTPFAPLANWTMTNRPIRWLIEKLFKIDRRAPLPQWSGYTLRGWARKHLPRAATPLRWTYGLRSWLSRTALVPLEQRRLMQNQTQQQTAVPSISRKVVYFHGCSTNYYEPHVGKAALEVLNRNGCEVVLANQGCCGLPMLSNGEFKAARRYHAANVRSLLPWIRQGYVVVGTSTSCTLTLKDEAPELLGWHDPEVQLLAEQTYDIFEYLRLLDQAGEFDRNLGAIEETLPYHPPCQLKAHRIGLPARDILAHIPRLQIDRSQAACCGIAGTYGLKTEKYGIAMDVGKPLFEWANAHAADTVLCDSETCRWQISHGTGLETRHPVELLAEAYRRFDQQRQLK
ncbi:anaerobic glycerol-3-phosphate dehydrogenase subunit C [Herpetosiphon llansteffanensis]|uniref:anaerobic glycerol-3-phosphate dehydrogenase subunit C n=1 Tax=Herpetosiphon llansteffanensis TaxID=2094568 RepID=UPI000D7C39D2|nr:anaerobic glycerol-3-phosphate dehydrogenase subunit C [Herpetosiphon llansteffanensis]